MGCSLPFEVHLHSCWWLEHGKIKNNRGVFASPVHNACSCVPLSIKWPSRMSAERLLSKTLCYEDTEPNNNSKKATTPLSSKMSTAALASSVLAEGQSGVWWCNLVVWCKVQMMRRFCCCTAFCAPAVVLFSGINIATLLQFLCCCCCCAVVHALAVDCFPCVENSLPSPLCCFSCFQFALLLPAFVTVILHKSLTCLLCYLIYCSLWYGIFVP